MKHDNKKYLIAINSNVGATYAIGVYSNVLKPFRVYYCGQDTGKRYARLGDAAREVERVAAMWEANNTHGRAIAKTYSTGLKETCRVLADHDGGSNTEWFITFYC